MDQDTYFEIRKGSFLSSYVINKDSGTFKTPVLSPVSICFSGTTYSFYADKTIKVPNISFSEILLP